MNETKTPYHPPHDPRPKLTAVTHARHLRQINEILLVLKGIDDRLARAGISDEAELRLELAAAGGQIQYVKKTLEQTKY